MSSEKTLKYVLLGDAECGKSAFCGFFDKTPFQDNYQSTISVDFKLLRLNNKNITLFDTAGQEKFKEITEYYKKNTDVFIVMFDLTRQESFKHAKKEIKSLQEKYEGIPIILVGTKSDLKNQINEEEITGFNVNDQYHYIATSAKNKTNISDVLIKGMELHKNNLLTEDNDSLLNKDEVNEKVPVPSSSLALKISFGVFASLAGSAAIIIGAIAIAAILTAIAPPIGIAMIVGGAAALLTGVGLFGSAASTHKQNKQLNEFNDNINNENMI